jgi:hypothetical protein
MASSCRAVASLDAGSMTRATTIKQRFHLDRVVLVGDRRMITETRIAAPGASPGADFYGRYN